MRSLIENIGIRTKKQTEKKNVIINKIANKFGRLFPFQLYLFVYID